MESKKPAAVVVGADLNGLGVVRNRAREIECRAVQVAAQEIGMGECRLKANCPTTGSFLECNSAADCAAYGGGKICCRATSGAQTMQYCTKSSGCPGTTLP